MADNDTWRRRFFVFTAARIFGLLTLLAGVAIMFSDLLRPGGWPLVGGVVMIMGLIDSVIAPILLKKHWAGEDKEHQSALERPVEQRTQAPPPDRDDH